VFGCCATICIRVIGLAGFGKHSFDSEFGYNLSLSIFVLVRLDLYQAKLKPTVSPSKEALSML